jgi:hypothetical protein
MRPRPLVLLLSFFLALSLTASAQEAPLQGGGQQVYVTAIEIVADVRDAKGNVPAELKPGDFVVIEDGVERAVVGLDYLRAERIAASVAASPAAVPAPAAPEGPPLRTPWQNVLYFETTLSNGQGRIAAARKMMEHVETLVQMGAVDVVFADPTPRALVRNSRDASAIRTALQTVTSSAGTNRLAAHRRQFLRDITELGGMESLMTRSGRSPMANPAQRRSFDSAGTPEASTMDATALKMYVEEEVQMISAFRESLLSWLSSYPRHVPRNLLMVTDGFDVNPVEFYGSVASSSTRTELRTVVSQSALGESATRMGQLLAAGAWTTVSIPSDNNSDGWVDDASTSAIGRVHGSVLGRAAGRPKAFLYRPLDPLHLIADTTGGKVVANSGQLAGALEDLDDRIKLTYQVDRKPDGKARKVEVHARNRSLRVRAARFAASSTPAEMADRRAVNLLRAAAFQGDLNVDGVVDWEASGGPTKRGTLRAVADVALVRRLLDAGAKGQFRITLAVQVGNEAVVVNRSAADYDVSQGVFRFRTPLELPGNATAVVMVIEETTTGLWGSTRFETL